MIDEGRQSRNEDEDSGSRKRERRGDQKRGGRYVRTIGVKADDAMDRTPWRRTIVNHISGADERRRPRLALYQLLLYNCSDILLCSGLSRHPRSPL